jgi:hypothetical protein
MSFGAELLHQSMQSGHPGRSRIQAARRAAHGSSSILLTGTALSSFDAVPRLSMRARVRGRRHVSRLKHPPVVLWAASWKFDLDGPMIARFDGRGAHWHSVLHNSIQGVTVRWLAL